MTAPVMPVAQPHRQSSEPPQPSQNFSSRQGPASSFGGQPLQSSPVGPGFSQGPPHLGQVQQQQHQVQQHPVQQHERSFSQGQPIPTAQYNNGSVGRTGQGHTYNSPSISSNGPPQLSTLPFQNTAPLSSSFGPISKGPPQNQTPVKSSHLPPLKPVFGMTLEQLFERDGSAVPMVVYQCIQAVDLYGLEVEGIYRLSGTTSHVNKIKAMFDNGKLRQLM